MTPASTHREVELKVRVGDDFVLPDLTDVAGVVSVQAHPAIVLRAAYHDTESANLLRWGITMRRREGGHDEGWHLKLPVAGARGPARDELHLPLSEGEVGSVPPAFIHVVSPLLRDQPVVALAVVETTRTAYDLVDAEGIVRAELVDDRVQIYRSGARLDSFHEIEIEAADSSDPVALAMLESVSALLIAQGGRPSSVSKAAGALGPQAALPPDVPDLPMPRGRDLAVDAMRAVMARHVRHLLMADVGVRRDLPDSVHQMRVAARRLRSTLAAYAPLLDAERAAPLREELKWLASELGAVRDTEVMQERLDAHARELGEPFAEAAASTVDAFLGRRMTAARSSAIAALRSDRHQDLIEDLITAVAEPPVSDLAYGRCDQVLPPLLRKTWRRLERDARILDLETPSIVWHEARIRAKRARYAAEAVAEILGGDIPKLAGALAEVTEVLGTHQDAHVAQQVLIATAAQADGPQGFALGLLHEYEAEEEILDRVRFAKLWPRVQRMATKAGLA